MLVQREKKINKKKLTKTCIFKNKIVCKMNKKKNL